MYSRCVVWPITDLDEIVTLWVEVPGLKLIGNELPQPGLARARGVSPARTPRARVRGAIIAIVERKEADCRTDHLKPGTRAIYTEQRGKNATAVDILLPSRTISSTVPARPSCQP